MSNESEFFFFFLVWFFFLFILKEVEGERNKGKGEKGNMILGKQMESIGDVEGELYSRGARHE